MHTVLQKALVYALHVFVYGAHLGRANELGRKAQPRVLIALTRILDKFNRILLRLFFVVCDNVNGIFSGLIVLIVAHFLFVAISKIGAYVFE